MKSIFITLILILTALPIAQAQGPDDLAAAQARWSDLQPDYFEIAMTVDLTDESGDEPVNDAFSIYLFVVERRVKSATVWCDDICPETYISPPQYTVDAIFTGLEMSGEAAAFEVDDEAGYISSATIELDDTIRIIETTHFAILDEESRPITIILDEETEIEPLELDGQDTDSIPELAEDFENYLIAYRQISFWSAFTFQAVVMDGDVTAMTGSCFAENSFQPCEVWALDPADMTLEGMQEHAEEALDADYRDDFSVLKADADTGILTQIIYNEELVIDEEYTITVTDFAVIENVEDE